MVEAVIAYVAYMKLVKTADWAGDDSQRGERNRAFFRFGAAFDKLAVRGLDTWF